MNFASKYAPACLSDYHFVLQNQKRVIESYLDGSNTRPLLLYGPPGTGKTQLARILPKEICPDIQEAGDVRFLNGSLDNSIATIRDKIGEFCRLFKFNSLNRAFVVFDEGDGLSPNAQDALKAEIDALQHHTQFIFTSNHPERLKRPLVDRCMAVEFPTPTAESLLPYAQKVLQAEGQTLPDQVVLEVLAAGTGLRRELSFREMYRRLEQIVAGRREAQGVWRAVETGSIMKTDAS